MRSAGMTILRRGMRLCGAGVAIISGVVQAQPAARTDEAPDFPRRSVRVVVPSAPGGGTDFIARLLAQSLSGAWGQPVVVDNVAGAATTIGMNLVAKAAPDGYTVLMTTLNFAFVPAIYTRLPYDAERDFAPVALAASQANLLALHPAVPAKSVAELIALARAKPDDIRFGSGGSGSAGHLATELFRMTANIRLTHVPYKGTGPVTTAVMTGDIHMVIANIASLLPFVNAGRLRALAVTGLHRVPNLPSLPTVAESGLPGYEFDPWYGIWAPARTPAPVVKKINDDVNRALASAALRERFAQADIEALGGSTEKFATRVTAELRKWGAVARDANIKPE